MRRSITLATVFVSTVALIAARPAFAASDSGDQDLFEYLQDRMTDSGDSRKERREALTEDYNSFLEQRRNLQSRKTDRDAVKEIKADLKQLEGEEQLVQKLKSQVFSQINTETEVKAKIQSQIDADSFAKAVAADQKKYDDEFAKFIKEESDSLAKTDPKAAEQLKGIVDKGGHYGDLEKASADALKQAKVDWAKKKENVETDGGVVIALKDSPFDLVAKFEQKDDKWLLSYDIKVKDDLNSVSKNVLTKSIREKFKSDEELKNFLKDQIGPVISDKSVEIDLKGKDLHDPAASAGITNALRAAVQRSSGELLFGKTDAAARAGLEDLVKERYSNDDTSDKSKKKQELKDATDNPDKRADLADLKAKQDVALWLRNNDPGTKTPCEVIAEVFHLKGEEAAANWKRLSPDTQQNCPEYSPEIKAKAAAEEKAKKDEERKLAQAAEGESAKSDPRGSEADDAQVKADAEFRKLVAYCLSAYRNQAAQSGMQSIVDTVGPIYDALQKQGLGCSTYGQLMGELSDPNLLAYMPPNALQEKAFDIVHPTNDDGAPVSGMSNADLKKEQKCLNNMVAMAGNSLGMVMGKAGELSPAGLQDPNIQKDPKLQQLYRIFQAATALQAAVQNEIGTRGAINQSGFRAVGPGAVNGRPIGPPGSVGVDGGAPGVGVGTSTGADRGGDEAARARRGLSPVSPRPMTGGNSGGAVTRPSMMGQ